VTLDDFLDRDGLLALGLDEHVIDRLLRDTSHSGHDGRPVVDADRLPELLDMIQRARDQE
jgi:hypothetical protein